MVERPFNAGEPIAYFITWTTYGTWLPGDERGWWREGEHHAGNPLFREMAAAEMKEPAFSLPPGQRPVVEETITRHCEIRSWTMHAVAARWKHVHVVVTAPGYPPERVRDQFKAWCTRALKPRSPNRQRFWTEGGSCRFINHEEDLEAAIVYVKEGQDRPPKHTSTKRKRVGPERG